MTFYEKMRLVCLSIPAGRVATYGQIAMLCGAPRNARQVGYGLREGLAGEDIPAFRVVNGKGDLTGANSFPQPDMQPALLAAEGVSSPLERPLLACRPENIRLAHRPPPTWKPSGWHLNPQKHQIALKSAKAPGRNVPVPALGSLILTYSVSSNGR